MRILAGHFKGRNLSASNDLSIRPITNRLKETIFSILNDYINEKKVLDLFSGSGSLGLEALSRGACHITFVEKEDSSIKVLNKNVNNLKVTLDNIKIINSDVIEFLDKSTSKYQLVFSDPPFKYDLLQNMIDQIFLSNSLDQNGLVVLHHEIDNPIKLKNVPYELLKQKKIGRSLLSFISKETKNV